MQNDLTPRPREKLMSRGAESLEDAELFALLLGSGVAGRPVMQVAHDLIQQFGGVAGILSASWEQLRATPGIGTARFAIFQAARELARRAAAEPLSHRPLMGNPVAVEDFLVSQLACLPHEVFAVMFLDARHRLIRFEKVFQGSLTQTSVYPREIARRCLRLNAAAVIVAHNHPSGTCEPSLADQLLTTALRKSLAGLEIDLLDHLLVAGNRAVSIGAV
jgi:DNA repair protein RadC